MIDEIIAMMDLKFRENHENHVFCCCHSTQFEYMKEMWPPYLQTP